MWRWCHRQSHSNGTQTMYHALNCFQESLVEEILRSFWGNRKWGWGPTEAEYHQAKICNACDFWINIFSCEFDAQRFTRQREKNLLVRNKTINSNNIKHWIHGCHIIIDNNVYCWRATNVYICTKHTYLVTMKTSMSCMTRLLYALFIDTKLFWVVSQ